MFLKIFSGWLRNAFLEINCVFDHQISEKMTEAFTKQD